jgi:hypothetical protein
MEKKERNFYNGIKNLKPAFKHLNITPNDETVCEF